MSGADYAAFLLFNPKQRFFIDIHIQWEWKPYGVPPSYEHVLREKGASFVAGGDIPDNIRTLWKACFWHSFDEEG